MTNPDTAPSLTDFLLARIDEDETVARAAREHEYLSAARDASQLRWSRDAMGYGSIFVNSGRVLAECAAKRRTLDWHGSCGSGVGYCDDGGHALEADEEGGPGCADLFNLASVYADHPDYRQEWAL